MAADGNAYSRFVAWAKIVLPLAGLALLATMFLIARQIDPDAAIPNAEVDVRQYAREARVGGPRFSSVTEDGTVVAATADIARPDPATPGRITAEGVDAQFDVPDGSTVHAAANEGAFGGAAGRLDLAGEVVITTSSGYRILSDAMTATLGFTEIRSDGPVTAVGPPGRIDAGSMAVTQSEDDPSDYLLVFNDGVKLVYRPEVQD